LLLVGGEMIQIRKGRGKLFGTFLAVIVACLVLLAGMGVPVGSNPGPIRSIEPETVIPGGDVNVTIEFTTLYAFNFLSIVDWVPLGWTVTDIRVNDEANAALYLYTTFNSTNGAVIFLWLVIDSGVPVRAEYTLSIPSGSLSGEYPLIGTLFGDRTRLGYWTTSIPNGSVIVQLPYEVELTADEAEKTTEANVNATYHLTVKNKGTNPDTYALSIISSDADFSALNKTSVSLGPDEIEIVELRVASAFSGRYNTTIRAASAYASDNVTITTVVSRYGVDLKVEDEESAAQTVEPNVMASYTLTVRNTGTDPDNYTLTLDNLNGAYTAILSEPSVLNLSAGASADVTLNVSDAAEGRYMVNVTATSQGDPGVSDAIATVTTVAVAPDVIPLPEIVNPPTDPDEDGLYEDLNGNGRKDFDDVVQLFNFMEWIEANEPTACFDFNGNGRIDFDDIVQLFGEL